MTTQTLDDTVEIDQTHGRIFFGQVRMGDFVRFGGHKVTDHYRLQWWKVLEVDDFQMILVNTGGGTLTVTERQVRAGQGMKIYLHKYSAKHNR